MKIIYIHHANRDRANPPTQEDGITEIGREDALLTAKLIGSMKEKYNICGIVTSTFFRCTETAKIINEKLSVPIILEPRINEYKSMGDETWVECQTRITEAIIDCIKTHDDRETIIFVTSGLNIAPFISLVYGINPNENVPFIGVPSCSPIIFDIEKSKIQC